MAERSPYSRVYWTIADDERFSTVYDHDAYLAAWLRLLLIADQAWPASGHLPASVAPRAVKALADCGLLILQSGHRFRIHGMDAERNARSNAARNAAAERWNSARISTPMPRRDETRQDETSRAETSHDTPRRVEVVTPFKEKMAANGVKL